MKNVIPNLALRFALVLVLGWISVVCRAEVHDPAKYTCQSTDPQEQELAAGSLLQAGVAFFNSGDYTQAENAWRRSRECSQTVSTQVKAIFNLGVLEKYRKQPTSAIEYFVQVIGAKPDDKEPGGSIMETSRNYTHRAALNISECYEEMGQYSEALRWAQMANTTYRYHSWCGNCYDSQASFMKKRIAYLAIRSNQLYLVSSVLLLGAFLSWKRVRNRATRAR